MEASTNTTINTTKNVSIKCNNLYNNIYWIINIEYISDDNLIEKIKDNIANKYNIMPNVIKLNLINKTTYYEANFSYYLR